MPEVNPCPGVWLTKTILDSRECENLVLVAETRGFQPAHQMSRGRNNSETFVYLDHLVESLKTRLNDTQHGLPFQISALPASMEFYRYHPGQFVASHWDASSVIDADRRSSLSLVIYLNADFEGGGTKFLEDKISVRPLQGQAVLFQHEKLHEGSLVTEGTKYILRMNAAITTI